MIYSWCVLTWVNSHHGKPYFGSPTFGTYCWHLFNFDHSSMFYEKSPSQLTLGHLGTFPGSKVNL